MMLSKMIFKTVIDGEECFIACLESDFKLYGREVLKYPVVTGSGGNEHEALEEFVAQYSLYESCFEDITDDQQIPHSPSSLH